MENKDTYEKNLLERINKSDIVSLIKKRDAQIVAMKYEIEGLGKGWLQYYIKDKILFFYGGRENKNMIQINLT